MGWAVGWAGAVARRGSLYFFLAAALFFPQDWEKEEGSGVWGVLPSPCDQPKTGVGMRTSFSAA